MHASKKWVNKKKKQGTHRRRTAAIGDRRGTALIISNGRQILFFLSASASRDCSARAVSHSPSSLSRSSVIIYIRAVARARALTSARGEKARKRTRENRTMRCHATLRRDRSRKGKVRANTSSRDDSGRRSINRRETVNRSIFFRFSPAPNSPRKTEF